MRNVIDMEKHMEVCQEYEEVTKENNNEDRNS